MIAVLCGLSEEAATVTERRGVLVLTGTVARDKMDKLIPPSCEGIVSWGTAGSVSKLVPVGAVVILRNVYTDAGVLPTNKAWHEAAFRSFAQAYRADGWSGPKEVSATAKQKAALAQKYPVATADEGAYAVLEFATKRNIPALVVQGISDAYDQDVPSIAAFGATNADGSPDIGALVGQLIQNPDQIGGLLEVASTFWQALAGMRACYAALGSRFALP